MSQTADPTLRWEDARRVEAWAGEVRVNFIRASAVAAFYGHHLLRQYVLTGTARPLEYHQAVTLVTVAFALMVVALQHALARRVYPPWLKFVSSALDTFLVTLYLVAGGGPKSPLTAIYFIVLAASALRLSLRLVWATTAFTLTGYLGSVLYTIRFKPEWRIPHDEQVVFMLALVGTGLVAGQMVRQARRLIQGSPVEVEEA